MDGLTREVDDLIREVDSLVLVWMLFCTVSSLYVEEVVRMPSRDEQQDHHLQCSTSAPSFDPLDTTGRHQYVFTCVTIEGKDYCIQASTRDEMFVWIKVISEAMVRTAF